MASHRTKTASGSTTPRGAKTKTGAAESGTRVKSTKTSPGSKASPATPKKKTSDAKPATVGAKSASRAASAAKQPARVATAPTTRWKVVPASDSAKRASLSPVRLEQLAVLATFYDGLGTTPETIPPGLFSNWVKLSKVLEDGEHRFDMWTIGSDEGCLFWRDDKEPVGVERIQGGWGEYPKKDWVVRGLKLDLRQLAWDLDHLTPQPAYMVPEPRPAPSKPDPMRWKARRQRRDPDDCG